MGPMVASLQTIESVIAAFGQAAEANRTTPARQGNVVVLSKEVADDVLVAGDLHGNRLHFRRILELADLENRPRRHLVVQEVCHGGPLYPSQQGCMSHLLLEDVARLKIRYPDRVHFLLSNHELAELTDFPISKGGRLLNLLFRLGLKEFFGSAADRVHAAHGDFIRSSPLGVRLSNGVFISHSAPALVDSDGFDVDVLSRELTDADLRQLGAAFDLVWGRDFRPENARAFAELVGADVLIHGHEPCPDGFQVPNRRQIILDGYGPAAAYIVISTGEEPVHERLVERIERLF